MTIRKLRRTKNVIFNWKLVTTICPNHAEIEGAVHRQADKATQSSGVKTTHRKSAPPTKVNSLFVFDEVNLRGEFIIGKAYETSDAISME